MLDRIEPEPGYGMVTLFLHPDDDPETPEAMVVPIGAIRRIELRSAPEDRVSRVGFSIRRS